MDAGVEVSKKKKKQSDPPPQPLPARQLWVVERRINDKVHKIYVFADRWFDVREAGGIKLRTSKYDDLFISQVNCTIDVFEDPEVFVYEVQYLGSAASNTLEKKIVSIHRPRRALNGKTDPGSSPA